MVFKQHFLINLVIFFTINMSRSRTTFSSLRLGHPSFAISDFCGSNNTIVLTRTLYNPSHERWYHQSWCIVLRIILIANGTVMRSIDMDSCICLTKKLMKSTTFLRKRLFLSASWIQGAKQVPNLWSQKKANKRSVKMFASPSAFVPSASLPLKIIWRSFLGHRWMCYHRHHHSWPSEEVYFDFGECSFSVITIEDHLKKLPWPSVNVLSSAPPFLTIWRSIFRLRWVFHQLHYHGRSLEEVFFAF